jgi:hypothetical protein
VLNTIRESWGWTGLDPAEVVVVNEFGNIIVRAHEGAFWRICPEQLSCEVIAKCAEDYESIWLDGEFQRDWQMARLVQVATHALGPLDAEHCYCLKIPAVLGGEYDLANFGTISRRELIAFSGDVAQQIKDLPDGTPFTVKFV